MNRSKVIFIVLSEISDLVLYKMTNKHKRWLPLESNPEVMNDFAGKLGLDTSAVSFCDVFGLDEVRWWIGSWTPSPHRDTCLQCRE